MPLNNSFSILRLYNEVDEQLAIQEKSFEVYGKYNETPRLLFSRTDFRPQLGNDKLGYRHRCAG